MLKKNSARESGKILWHWPSKILAFFVNANKQRLSIGKKMFAIYISILHSNMFRDSRNIPVKTEKPVSGNLQKSTEVVI
jgi:hypothetical protein